AARAGRTSLLVFAADRLTGAPLAGVRLKASLEPVYDLSRVARDLLDARRDPDYRAGLEDAFRFFAGEKEAGPAKQEELRRAGPEFLAGWNDGIALRRRFPAEAASSEGASDAEGLLSVEVPPSLHEHAYKARVESSDPGMCFWCSVDSSPDAHRKALKALVYADRPLYRPGDEVHFKGIVRLFDGEHYFLPGPAPIDLEVRQGEKPVHRASLVPDDAGTVHGSFALPPDAALGAYDARVGELPESPLFQVRHFEKPGLDVSVEADQAILAAGEALRARIRVTAASGEPRPGAEVRVSIRRVLLELEHRAAFRLPGETEPGDLLERGGKTVFDKPLIAGPSGEAVLEWRTDPGFDAAYRVEAVGASRPSPTAPCTGPATR
ncbi:MAG: MG2 domain-containing protein, partial [Planctomycetes bacterium]|nr:MG2 domain-containing protein [Planctomycetota bacterium]